MPIRSLSKELQQVAIKELNEVPSRVQADINHIREWISQQPHLKARTDDQWLLAFLRNSKFSLQRTKENIDSYYTTRTLAPEFQSNKDPFSPEIQEILREGIFIVLPKTAHDTAPRTVILQMQKMNPEKMNLITLFKVGQMMADILILEDDNFMVTGMYVILSLKEFPLSYMSQLTVNYLKMVIMYIQETYPLRIKELQFFNSPSFIVTIYNMVKIFISKKLRDRVVFSSGENLETKTIPRSIVPQEYGGDEVSCDEIARYWKAKVESYRDWFLEDAQYGTDESKRLENLKLMRKCSV